MTNISVEKTTTQTTSNKVAKPEVQNNVYSKDKNIWVGMTVNDASKSTQLMELFDFADYDRNGKIDEQELQRYDGPIFVENFETSDTRVIGHYAGFGSAGSFGGKLIKDTEIDYYPGLTIEKVNEKGRKMFTLIDGNHDGVLSAEEVTKIAEIKDKADNVTNTVKKLAEEKEDNSTKAFGIPVIGSAALGIIAGIGQECVSVGFMFGCGAGLAVGAVALGGYLLYEHFTSNREEQANELINNLEKEIGNEPYAQENNIIGNLRNELEDLF